MPKKDFTQVAHAVFQQATGEAPKPAERPKKKAASAKTETATKKPTKKG